MDDLLRHPADEPSIGLILCKGKNQVMAEYALRDVGKPIGISGFRLAESLPASLKGKLPTIADLEAELSASEPLPAGKETPVEPGGEDVKPVPPTRKASRRRKP